MGKLVLLGFCFRVLFSLRVGFFVSNICLLSVPSLIVSRCVSLIILIKSLGLVYIFPHVCLVLFVESLVSQACIDVFCFLRLNLCLCCLLL